MKYIAVDIGCLECAEASSLIGVYDSRKTAEVACLEYVNAVYGGSWGGQHRKEIFEWDETGLLEVSNG